MALRVKRIYEEPEEADGERILVDRLWPRGLSRENASITAWRRDLAPSDELRRWFSHNPARWEGFMRRYRAEIEGKAEKLLQIGEQARERDVTLLFAARDADRNNARALAAFIRELVHDA